MNLEGLSDSIASIHPPPAKCRRCGAAARIEESECLYCLLYAGVESPEEGEAESLSVALEKIGVEENE